MKEYIEIASKEREIANLTLNLLKATLIEKGRISFRPDGYKSVEDLEDLDITDYPIVTNLCGRNDYPNIGITDVYMKNNEIYADGIDMESAKWRKEFQIISDQFSDILYFIAVVLGWNENIEEQIAQYKSQKIKATIILGEGAVRHFEETGRIPNSRTLESVGGIVLKKEFDSNAEYISYTTALEESDNWGLYSNKVTFFIISLYKPCCFLYSFRSSAL